MFAAHVGAGKLGTGVRGGVNLGADDLRAVRALRTVLLGGRLELGDLHLFPGLMLLINVDAAERKEMSY